MNNLMDNNENEDFDFSKYLVNDQNQNQKSNEDEGWLSTLLRGGVRSGKRGLEAFAGGWGNNQELLNTGIDYLRPGTSDNIPIPKLPTSSDIREYTKTEYTEPKNETEAFLDDVVSDFATFISSNPFKAGYNIGKRGLSLGRRMLNAIGKAIIGNSAEKVVENAGGPEWAQKLTKAGYYFFSSLYDPGRMKRKYQDLYKKVTENLPETLEGNFKNASRNIRNLTKKANSGLMYPDKKTLISDLKNIENKLNSGKMRTGELFELRSDLNDKILSKNTPPKLKRHYIEAKKIVDDSIDLALKNHPQQLKDFREANSLFYADKETQKTLDTLFESLDPQELRDLTIIGKEIFDDALYGVKTAAGYTALKASKNAFKKYNTNSATRKLFLDIVKDAAKGNKKAVVLNFKDLKKTMGFKDNDEDFDFSKYEVKSDSKKE